MKKIIFLLAATLVVAGAYAQTQRTNRTNTRPHDRSVTKAGLNNDAKATEQDKANRTDRMHQETDIDRNNPNNNGVKPKTEINNGSTDKKEGTDTKGTNTNK